MARHGSECPGKPVLFVGDILKINVVSILLLNVIQFAKFNTANYIISSEYVIDNDIMTIRN